MEPKLLKTAGWSLAALMALFAATRAVDTPYAVHMFIFAAAAVLMLLYTLARDSQRAVAGPNVDDPSRYDDDVVRWGVIATTFWGVVGLLAGLYIASQLAFPFLNLDIEYTSFGRLRPLHTSAVIFAFGGNALIATSFFVVQRTCRARLAFGGLARFVFWGYQLFIVLAASGYVMGVTAAREYAEPEWHVDIWLTICSSSDYLRQLAA